MKRPISEVLDDGYIEKYIKYKKVYACLEFTDGQSSNIIYTDVLSVDYQNDFMVITTFGGKYFLNKNKIIKMELIS